VRKRAGAGAGGRASEPGGRQGSGRAGAVAGRWASVEEGRGRAGSVAGERTQGQTWKRARGQVGGRAESIFPPCATELTASSARARVGGQRPFASDLATKPR
jgi:hypothetical protein